MLLPPGHDAWVGEEPCVFVDFSAGYDRYDGSGAKRERLG
jgi:hypothetical protein